MNNETQVGASQSKQSDTADFIKEYLADGEAKPAKNRPFERTKTEAGPPQASDKMATPSATPPPSALAAENPKEKQT